jgi:hypothetical protein
MSQEKDVEKTKVDVLCMSSILSDDDEWKIFCETFLELDEKELKDMVSYIDDDLKTYPPTKEQEQMLSRIQLGDVHFSADFDCDMEQDLFAGLSSVEDYSNVKNQFEDDVSETFVTRVELGGRVVVMTSGFHPEINEIMYWHGIKGWIQMTSTLTLCPMILLHLDDAEHYRFVYDLFHEKDGTHKVLNLSKHIWRPPTTEKSSRPPFFPVLEILDDRNDEEEEEDI